jgi:alpha-L-fucosidase
MTSYRDKSQANLPSADRRRVLIGAVAAGIITLVPVAATGTGELDPRIAAFRQRKFGMFVHWGPYSQASVEASWPIMEPTPKWPISEKNYVELARTFNPTAFDPDALVELARSTGQKYMVFTTKHHDGFCMFDSMYTDYKITKSPYGKDIVRMLSDACARHDLPLGFYYSPPDLHHPGFRDTSKPASTNWGGEPQRPEWASYLAYMELQLSELLGRYGPVETIWFDGLHHQEKYDGQRFIDSDDRVQDRLVQGVPDPDSFQDWETCMTINNTWAYNSRDHEFKSARDLIRTAVEVFSRGGNFLLNIGPKPDGTIPSEFRERLGEIGNWMAANGESVYGTMYGPIQGQRGYRTTAKDGDLFVHILDMPPGRLTLPGWGRKVGAVRLLADKRPLNFIQSGTGVDIDLTGIIPDPAVTVLKVYVT